MALTTMYIEVKDASGGTDIGDRWKDGTTKVILTPTTEVTGKWNTDRPSDLDSSGGTDGATYLWRQREGFLLLELPEKKGLQNALLVLTGMKEFKYNSSGNGSFHYKSLTLAVTWQAILSGPEPAEKQDHVTAQKARIKIEEAKSRTTRKLAELSLNEADGYARTIKDDGLRTTIEGEIQNCREELDKKNYKNQK
jgi:hypothetical protein